jgi:cytochrome c5
LTRVNAIRAHANTLNLEGQTMRYVLCAAGVFLLALDAGAAPQGDKVYARTCVVCHADGLSGAPRLGNAEEWKPRVPAGKAALVDSVRKGKGLMPPRGGNDTFTDDDLRAAVDYMLSKVTHL